MKFKCLLAVALLFSTLAASAAKPKVIAHRGFWKTEGSAQNSITALQKAAEAGCYGSEFDIWMTPDGVIIVNHDPTINGVEIQNTPSQTVLKEKLSNGETVPTLDAYYAEAQKYPGMRLICELKSHDSNARERAAIAKILELAKKYNLENRIDYITFSKNGFSELIKKAPEGTNVYYLNGDYIPEQVQFMKGRGVDYHLKALKNNPDWIKRCHDLGLEVNVWTIDKPEDMKWCIENGVDYITTNEPVILKEIIASTPEPAPAKATKKSKKK